MISFWVPGVPAPGGSKRMFYNKQLKRSFIVPASKKTKPWMDSVRSFATDVYKGHLLEGSIKLSITFHQLRPKSHYGTGKNAHVLKPSAPNFPTVMPDLTKLVRSTEDALTGIIWKNDSQVVTQHTGKVYGHKPGADIIIEERD